jgi:chromate transport protein ChrA
MSIETEVVRKDQTEKLPAKPAGRGFVSAFALEPRAAMLFFATDVLVFSGDAISAGLLIPVGIAVGAVLGFITYKIQKRWACDDHDSALIKAVAVGLLTAIPVPVGPFLAVPAGLLGIVRRFRRK